MSSGATFESFEKELNRLVESFGKRLVELKRPGYAEAQLRDDFLNPMFRALGWDMENRAGLIQREREVEIESATQIGGGRKRADYLFRADKRDRFVCEAKKPAEELHASYAFQAKRYAWNKGVPVAVLTDFEELKIYIVGGKPHIDEPEVGEWKSYRFQQYPLIARELWDLLARDKIAAGSIDAALDALPKKNTGTGKARQQWLIKPDRNRALDTDFLEFLDETRRDLASDIYKNNDHDELLEGNKLTEACQRVIDRILFLRICEDRDIDTGERLQSIVDKWRKNTGNDETGRRAHQQPFEMHERPPENHGVTGTRAPTDSLWSAVVRHFRALDRRPPTHVPFFNGNLFKAHFTEALVIGDEWLAGFIGDLSDDESPYLFNVIDVEILGSVYERFLGKVVRPQGRGITIEEKPEVRKAGGVYYTPRYIVDYIVEQTAGKLLNEIAAEKEAEGVKAFATRTEKLRLLDPACGSGSFLIRAFERVCEHWQKRLTAALPPKEQKAERTAWEKKHRAVCWVDPETGDVHLTVALKRQILTQNIYGVDLDSAAVEVTQLSLYLKMLENENRTTLQRQRELLSDETEIALLPPLQDNIKCGNSLIASDFSMMPEDLVRVHAFDWPVQFQSIMKAGGFDAVIGNPPYIRIQTLQESDPESVNYLNEHYAAAAKGNYDIYVVFVERALSLLNPAGRMGYILPHKFFNAQYGEALRQHLAKGKHVNGIVHFGDQQIFDGAMTYTCLLFLGKQPTSKFDFVGVRDLAAWQKGGGFTKADLPSSKLELPEWTFSASPNSSILERVCTNNAKLADVADRIFQGLVTGADPVFILEKRGKGVFYSEALEREVQLESDLLHPLCKGSVNVRRYEIDDVTKSILFPYHIVDERAVLIPANEFAKKYPKCWRYLGENRKALEGRERGKWHHDKWYAFGRSQNLAEMEQEKILTPSIAKRASFTHDLDDFYYFIGSGGGGGGGYGITLKPDAKESYRYLLALLNSKLLDTIVKSVSSPFANGYYAYNRQYIEQLPIRRIDFSKPADKTRHDKLVMLVDKLLGLMPKLRAATAESEKAVLQNAVTATDQQIDALVYELYGLTEDEIKLVEGNA